MYKLFMLCLLFIIAVARPSAAQTLKGTLYYDLGKARSKPATGLVVYLIPDSRENSKIIKDNANPQASYSEEALSSAKGYKKAVSNSDGFFYFTNISKGKYYFKVCTYYGGFYSVDIKAPFRGTIALPKFKADTSK